MATLTVRVGFRYRPSEAGQPDESKEFEKDVTMAGDDLGAGLTQTIGTTEETLSKGDITAIGYILVKNLDATNYVEIGTTTAVYAIKLKAREIALFRASGNTIYAKANTADVRVQYWIFED